MKKYLALSLLALTALASACSGTREGKPLVEPSTIISSPENWHQYERQHVRFYEQFTAFDAKGEEIPRGAFLERLAQGNYYPVRLRAGNGSFHYQLYKLSPYDDDYVRAAVRQTGQNAYGYFQMEGKTLPDFSFVDLKGNVYTQETLRGKTVVLKGWFIKCTACVREMPELNQLVKQYENRDDILFLSLAFDSEEDLKAFAQKRAFDYAIVPSQEKYLREDLNLSMYPTHIVINKQGLITYVVNDVRELIPLLERQVRETS
ncbi:hypothetical protein GCM10027275_14800 [Rhabdobacter roseus]|uniref:Peroxiredoxin n=1 Tax=Rhabdobacter roseus TaxID=1655419 RepID=A0A840TTS9_9BACT|nr:TlpA disulfide reductase family protein [Rhabdobacter roseus]MBB5283400.1 peroxiredoxin [Rhabdobacter roseus]